MLSMCVNERRSLRVSVCLPYCIDSGHHLHSIEGRGERTDSAILHTPSPNWLAVFRAPVRPSAGSARPCAPSSVSDATHARVPALFLLIFVPLGVVLGYVMHYRVGKWRRQMMLEHRISAVQNTKPTMHASA